MPFNNENQKMYKMALVSAIFTVIVLLLVNYIFTHSWGLSSSTKQPFSVQGTSIVTADPDQAIVYFTVSKTNKTLVNAQDEANTFVNKIVSDLQTLGIAKEDIKTDNYNSYPNYTTNFTNPNMPIRQDSQTIISYSVNESITITIHDTTKVNDVVNAVTKDGAENISGPNFSLSDAKQKSLTADARTKAIEDAKQKANDISKAAGINLGRITNIQEGNSGSPVPIMYDSKAVGLGGGGVAPTQINPGQNTINETVTLFYDTW